MKSSQLALPESRDEQHARSLARRLILEWAHRSDPSAAHALTQYPFLFRYRSIAMDLAYEEYCLRSESGEKIDTEDFCKQFPNLLVSLRQRIAMHLLLVEEPVGIPPTSSQHWPQAGQQLMGYQIREEIGRGSFARVYTATEKDLGGRLVVIKVCAHGEHEADTLGRIEHPAIVPVHSVKQDTTGLTVICMPMLGTDTLSQIIQQGSRSRMAGGRRLSHCQHIVRWLLPIARALDHAHGLGVLHLDLKPSNILVTDDRRPMLLDFNLSWDSTHDFHRTGGTLPYMSPEQISQLIIDPNGEIVLDQRSDIFSFGVILFELLHGTLPWLIEPDHDNLHDLAELLLERQKIFSSLDSPVTPGTLHKVIQGCLGWNPADRFQHMSEVVTTLEQFSDGSYQLAGFTDVRRRLVLTLAMTLGTAGFIGGLRLATNPPSGKKLVMQGQAAINHGRFDKAEILFTEAMQFSESSWEAQYRRGLARALNGNRCWAIDDFLSVREKKCDPRLDALVGYSYQLLCRYCEALDWYRLAIRNGFSQWQLWVNMGHVAMNQNLHGDARRYLDRAEKAGANGAEYFYARLLNESWEPDLSKQSIRQLAYWAHQLDRCQFTGPNAHADLARALLRIGITNDKELAVVTSKLEMAIYQGADVRELSRDPQLRDLFQYQPQLFHSEPGTQLSRPHTEPIPDLYKTIQILAEELQGSQRN